MPTNTPEPDLPASAAAAPAPAAEDAAAFEALLGRPVAEALPILAGRNSRVYRLRLADGGLLAAKRYHRAPGDPRDRLAVEYGALSFLSRAGLACVPRPIAADAKLGVAAYQFIEGEHIAPGQGTARDAAAMAAFALRLWELRRHPEAASLPLASAACLCPADLLEREIARRLAAFGQEAVWLGQDSPGLRQAEQTQLAELRAFLDQGLGPALLRFRAACLEALDNADPNASLDPALRTLSPSDFGLHNALRQADGGLVFLDFEYFGWDDPAKLLADALLHPGTNLGREQGRTLARGLGPLFRADPGLDKRVRGLYPLFGINWCLILLNEFLPAARERRRFAGAGVAQAARAAQLAKAKALLARLNLEHEAFPYDS